MCIEYEWSNLELEPPKINLIPILLVQDFLMFLALVLV